MQPRTLYCTLATFVLAQVLSSYGASWREEVEADWLRQDRKRVWEADNAKEPITPEDDAAGAVDGVETGNWGFHTAFERNPWWQVDLGQVLKLDHLIIYNRGDGFTERSSHLQVLISTRKQDFQQVYQHDGSVFYGSGSGKPLLVHLGGAEARFIRLALPDTNYFHLNEVEAYAAGRNENVALGKAATQSSVSPWSLRHELPGLEKTGAYPFKLVLKRGLNLAQSQRRLGVNTHRQTVLLKQYAADWDNLQGDSRDTAHLALYFRARWLIRDMALANPLLNFDSLLFVKRAPGMFPHMSDQYYGWWSRPGGGVFLLENFRSDQPVARCLTTDMLPGSFMGPDLSFDGKKLLFAYSRFHSGLANEPNKADKSRVPEDAFYHVFEMSLPGSGVATQPLSAADGHQLTHGKYDDFDPRYLPGGDILFLSTRKGIAIQCQDWFSQSTRTANQPDSYVRCGGDNYRPVPVFTMHALSANGSIRPLSALENFEWAPSIANDGRILYTRWDYIDRFNGHFFSLWSANQNGTNPQLLYGNYTVRPQVKVEARSIPGSSKLVFIAAAHHSNLGGTLCLLDRNRGTEGDDPLTRVTPEVPFPETEANAGHYYANPWPLSEEYFLVGWADAQLPPHGRFEDARNPVNAMGLYLLDLFGNLELLYRDPDISSVSPIPIVPRRKPPIQATLAALQTGGATNQSSILHPLG